MKYFKCDTCDAIVTEFGCKNHKHKRFTQVSGRELAEKIFTRSLEIGGRNEGEREQLVKKSVFIGKSGKVITTRRGGSRVDIQYGKYDPISKTTVDISKEDFYRILFSEGIEMVDERYLHSFYFDYSGSKKGVTSDFLSKFISTQASIGTHILAFLRDGTIHFTNDVGGWHGTDFIFRPNDMIALRGATPSLSADARAGYSKLVREKLYGDLLSPRQGCLTVMSLDVFYQDRTEKYVLFEILDYSELQQVSEMHGDSYEELQKIAKEVLIG
jgi:hypothetical protein